jgi:hypothetical protein
MSAAPDTDKQTNLINEYILYISTGKMTEMLKSAQYCSYKKLAENLKLRAPPFLPYLDLSKTE